MLLLAIICALCIAYSLVNYSHLLHAQEDSISIFSKLKEIEEVEVTSPAISSTLPGLTRVVTIILPKESDKAGIYSINEVIEYAAGIDIRQRGNYGVQADLSIRGGSFDNVIILLNGINISDPQTGHASMDIPVDKEAVERIEILRGSVTGEAGMGGLSGAINIVTKKGQENKVSASQIIGEHGLYRSNINLLLNQRTLSGVLSLSNTGSRGYTFNTDFELKNMYLGLSGEFENTKINLQAGLQDKKYGANGFYSPRYPNQYENSYLTFGSVKIESGEKIKISPSFYWRQRKDDYMLIRDNPSFYRNNHLTDIYGSSIMISYNKKRFRYASSLSVRWENILSTNLGNKLVEPLRRGNSNILYTNAYFRRGLSYNNVLQYSGPDFTLSGSLMIYSTPEYSTFFYYPGIEISYRLYKTIRAGVSYNSAGSLPSFTDLFYQDPEHSGNKTLTPGEKHSLEGILRFGNDILSGNLSLFTSLGNNITDWQWSDSDNRFSPINLSKYNTYGFEANVTFKIKPVKKLFINESNININYSYLEAIKSDGSGISKYNHLKHKLSLTAAYDLVNNISTSLKMSIQERTGDFVIFNQESGTYNSIPYEMTFLIDLQAGYNMNYMYVFVEISNLLNTKYIDAGTIEQPGRWISAGIRMDVPFKNY